MYAAIIEDDRDEQQKKRSGEETAAKEREQRERQQPEDFDAKKRNERDYSERSALESASLPGQEIAEKLLGRGGPGVLAAEPQSSADLLEQARKQASEFLAQNSRFATVEELDHALKQVHSKEARRDLELYDRRPFEVVRAELAAAVAKEYGLDETGNRIARDGEIGDLQDRSDHLRGRLEDKNLLWSQKMRVLEAAIRVEEMVAAHRENERGDHEKSALDSSRGGFEYAFAE